MDERKILSDLISYAADDYEDIADRLLSKYGAVARLAEADTDSLAEFVGDLPLAIYIKIAVALASRKVTDLFKFGKRHTDEEIETYFKFLFIGVSVETVYIMSKDNIGKVICCDYVSEGTVNGVDLLPRKLLEIALKRNAHSVILAHNHPGGTSKPSDEDYASYARIKALLQSAGINVESSIVVSIYGISKIGES